MNKLKKTLCSIVLGASALLGGCEVEKLQDSNANMIPAPRYNQTVIYLTDLDDDGKWDVANEMESAHHIAKVYFKKGHNPPRALPEGTCVKYVKPDFFKPYE